MTKTLIILNPHAAGGYAGKVWTELEPLLWKLLGELVVAITQHPEEVAHHIEEASSMGLRRIISIGGDGTNHALINALIEHNVRHPEREPMVYGNLPIGTGRDWARGLGIPISDPVATAHWIAKAQPQPTDIGQLTTEAGREYFLNIASAGMGGEVSTRVNRARVRRPWTFLQATVTTLLQHDPQPMRISLDEKPWYEGRAYVVAIANGTTFGHGMKIAPGAEVRDGLFDVVLIEAISRLRILSALQMVYQGTHLQHPAVHFGRASQVHIEGDGVTPLELDGEPFGGRDLWFENRAGLLHILS